MSFNKVILEGYVGKDPDIRETKSGEKMAMFSLATTEQWKDASGAKQSNTDWHNCICYKGVAGIIERFVGKGSNILIEGKLKNNNYTDASGNTQRSQQVNVMNVVLLKTSDAAPQPKQQEEAPKKRGPGRPPKQEDEGMDTPF